MEICSKEWKLFNLQAARKLIFASFCREPGLDFDINIEEEVLFMKNVFSFFSRQEKPMYINIIDET